MPLMPTNYMTGKRTIKAPKNKGAIGLDWGAGTRGWDSGGFFKDPVLGNANDNWTPDPITGMINPGYTSTTSVVTPPPTGGGNNGNGGGGGPDYRGILDRYTGDMRARINAGLASMNADRLSNARAAINRMGVRDPQAMLGKVSKYGLTLADLQAAADNPFSNIKAIDQHADRSRGQGEANFAARGGFRSGGTAGMYEDVENERARNEAMQQEDMLSGLGQGERQMADWQREQEDALAQRAAEYEMQLAQMYQPVNSAPPPTAQSPGYPTQYTAPAGPTAASWGGGTSAAWDDSVGGYRVPGSSMIYDQWGNVIRDLRQEKF